MNIVATVLLTVGLMIVVMGVVQLALQFSSSSSSADAAADDDDAASPNVRVHVEGKRYSIVPVSTDLSSVSDVAAIERLAWLRRCGLAVAAHMNDAAAMRVLSRCVIAESTTDVGRTIDKGRVIYVCIRNEGALLEAHNTLFVFLHEVAHTITSSVDHSLEFRRNFDRILQSAAALWIYDASALPSMHCGKRLLAPPPPPL